MTRFALFSAAVLCAWGAAACGGGNDQSGDGVDTGSSSGGDDSESGGSGSAGASGGASAGSGGSSAGGSSADGGAPSSGGSASGGSSGGQDTIAGGLNCDASQVLTDGPEPQCEWGKLPSVSGGSWTLDCVSVQECGCTSPGGQDQCGPNYICYNSNRCGEILH